MKLIKLYIILFSFLFCIESLSAQSKDTIRGTYLIYVEPAVNYGFLAAHKSNMHYLVNEHLVAYELCIGRHTNGKETWQALYGYPDYGFMYMFVNFKNEEILGNAHGFIPYLNFPLFRYNKRLKESFRLGAGIGYLTQKHNRLDNYKNFIIGSDLNAAISMHFITSLRLSQRMDLNVSFGLTHFSNGSFRQPNVGINIPSLRLSSKYNLGKGKPKKSTWGSTKERTDLKKFEYTLIGGVGVKEIWGRAEKEKFNIYFIESNISKPLSPKSSLAAGFDFFYDNSDLVLLDKDSISYNKKLEVVQPGVHLAHDLKISDLSIVFLTGKYLYQKEKSDGSIYTKLAIRYCMKEHLLMELSLKAHLATAEFIGYGIGYKF